MTSWQSTTVVANGLPLHYTRTGGDGPPVVLLHGFSDDGLCWTALAAALAPDYDVIMPDARGHGRSAAPEHGYGAREHAADLVALAAALGLDRPVVIGHSMGAIATLALAGSAPAVPRAVVVEDPPPWWVATSAKQAQLRAARAASEQWVDDLQRQDRAAIIAAQRAAAPQWAEEELGPWADAKLRLSRKVFSDAPADDLDWPALLGAI